MQLQKPMGRPTRGPGIRIAGLALAIALLASSVPAHADSDFENAFERQLGSILAFEAVAIGKAMLFPGAVPYPAPAYYAAPVAVPVPVAVPAPVPYYAVPVAQPVVYYGGRHGGHGYGRHGWHRRHGDCD